MLHVQLSNTPIASALHKNGIAFYFQYECNYSLKRLCMLSWKSQFFTTANERLFPLKGVCSVKPDTAHNMSSCKKGNQKEVHEAKQIQYGCLFQILFSVPFDSLCNPLNTCPVRPRKLLLALVIAVVLRFMPCQNSLPYFCSFQPFVCFEMELPLRRDFWLSLSLTHSLLCLTHSFSHQISCNNI
jgi:hypothetical protein